MKKLQLKLVKKQILQNETFHDEFSHKFTWKKEYEQIAIYTIPFYKIIDYFFILFYFIYFYFFLNCRDETKTGSLTKL